jgi:heme/copper-type cytochrome/quinol oxidase subunit 3
MNFLTTDRPAVPAVAPLDDDAPPNTTRLGMTLVLMAELMLFSGLVAAYLVLRSGSAALFADFGNDPIHRLIGVLAVTSLLFACAAVAIGSRRSRTETPRGVAAALTITLLAGAVVLGLTGFQWHRLLNRATVIAIDPASRAQHVYDGTAASRDARTLRIDGLRAPADRFPQLDPHAIGVEQFRDRNASPVPATPASPFTPDILERMATQASRLPAANDANSQPTAGSFDIALAGATVVTYGPWKNVYFSCFYLLSGTLALHVLVAMLLSAIALRRTVARTLNAPLLAATNLYWQFVTLATLVVSLLLYWT